jgi:hypothetical protein
MTDQQKELIRRLEAEIVWADAQGVTRPELDNERTLLRIIYEVQGEADRLAWERCEDVSDYGSGEKYWEREKWTPEQWTQAARERWLGGEGG